MKKLINIYSPSIKRKDLEYVLNCMIDEKIDYGDFAKNFEKRLSNRVGSKNVIVINSYFNAFSLILEALDVKEGDEIILPSFAPQVLLNVIMLKKAVPVLVDLEKNSLKPSIDGIKDSITEKTKALLIYYYFGYTYDPNPYIELVPNVIEDITSVLGAKAGEVPTGVHSKYAIANFSPKGLITTGEGAAVFCNDKKSYNKIFSLLEIDYDLDYAPRFSSLMPDLNAAMGVSQDEGLKHRLGLREKIGKIYENAIRKSHGASLIQEENLQRFYSDFPVIIKSSLKESIKYFNKNNIEVIRPFAFPLHHYTNLPKIYFPNTEYFYLNTLLIPIYSTLLKKNVDLIAKILASII